jgi:hypothetical protein
MAAIYLDNLIKPQKTYASNTNVALEPEPLQYTYKDLHLDLEFFQNIGNGLSSVNSKDIKIDHDIQAIRNSIHNIFSTSPGQKILSPGFGCSLEQFLFEQMSEFKANIIGNQILNNLVQYEPRINVNKVLVYPDFDNQTYQISVSYEIIDKGLVDTLQLNFNTRLYTASRNF